MGVDWASDPAKILENSMFLLQENFRTWKTHPETCMPIKILRSCLVHKHQYIHVDIHVKNPWKMSILGGATSRKIWKYVALNTCMGYFSNIKCSLEMWCDLISYVKRQNPPFHTLFKAQKNSLCADSLRSPFRSLVRAPVGPRPEHLCMHLWRVALGLILLKGGHFQERLWF